MGPAALPRSPIDTALMEHSITTSGWFVEKTGIITPATVTGAPGDRAGADRPEAQPIFQLPRVCRDHELGCRTAWQLGQFHRRGEQWAPSSIVGR